MNKKEKKRGGDYFRTPTSELEERLLELEAQLKVAGEMVDFESIASITESCADIIHVLNTRHMGRYIFPQALRALDEFHSLKLMGKLHEATFFLNDIIESKQFELNFLVKLKEMIEKKLEEGERKKE